MANVNATVPLDNFTQNGDTTLAQLLDSVAAVNGGNRPGVAEQIRDPATGKLIQVVLTMPDSAATAATNAINANPGVPTTVRHCYSQLMLSDLDQTAGIAFDGPANWGRDAGITAPSGPTRLLVVGGDGATDTLGKLDPWLDAGTYVDVNNLASAGPVRLFLSSDMNLLGEAAGQIAWQWLASETLTLKLSGASGITVAVSPSKDLVYKTNPSTLANNGGLTMFFYINEIGQLLWQSYSRPQNGGDLFIDGVISGSIEPPGYGEYQDACDGQLYV